MITFRVMAGCVILAVVQGVPSTMPPIKLNIRKGEDGELPTQVAVNLFINKDSCKCVSDTEPCLLELMFPDEEKEGLMATPCREYDRYCCKMKVNYDDVEINTETLPASENGLEEKLANFTPDHLKEQARDSNESRDADSKTDTLMAHKDNLDIITSQDRSTTQVPRHDDVPNSQDSKIFNVISIPKDIFRGQNPLLNILKHHIFRQDNNSRPVSQQPMQVALELFKEIMDLKAHVQKRSLPNNNLQIDRPLQKDNSTRKSKMLLCSCTTMNDCYNSWALIEDRPDVVVKTSLKCENPGEVTCCLGEIIPPRNFKVLHDKPVDASQYGQSAWNPIITSALQNLMSWFMS